jgi:hypothetical protein
MAENYLKTEVSTGRISSHLIDIGLAMVDARHRRQSRPGFRLPAVAL